jgi:hypothetical protein
MDEAALEKYLACPAAQALRTQIVDLLVDAAQSLAASRWTYLESQEYIIYSELRRVSQRQYVV